MSSGVPTVDTLFLKLEKVESKFEVVMDIEKGMNERMSDLSERIGEVRSMILERERTIDEMNSEVAKIKDIVHEIEPKRYISDLERQRRDTLKISAKIEKLDDVVRVTREEIKKSRDKLNKISGLESLSKFYKDIEKKSAEIENRVMKVRQLTSKTESIFAELSEKLAEIDTFKKRVDSLQDLTEDVMKDTDKVMVKLEKLEKMGLVSKDIIGKKPAWLNDEMETLGENMEKKFIDRFNDNNRAIMEFKTELDSLKDKQLELGGLQTMYSTYKATKTIEISEIARVVAELKTEIDSLKANNQSKTGN